MSVSSAALLYTLPFRARLACYDRPAASLAELMAAEDGDFVHLAAWTLLGRRATKEEYDLWTKQLATTGSGGQTALLALLADQATAEGQVSELPGLKHLLLLYDRASVPLVGSFLAGLTNARLRCPWIDWPVRFARSIPGKLRFAYRHSRKFAIRLAYKFDIALAADVNRSLASSWAPSPIDAPPRVRHWYNLMVNAINSHSGLR